MKQKKGEALTEMGAMKLLKRVVITTAQTGEILPEEALPFVRAAQKILRCETETQVVLLSAFVDMFDDNSIKPWDLANHFDVRRIDILSVLDELDFFIERGMIIRSREGCNGPTYRLSVDVIPALMGNHLPEPKTYSNLTIDELMEEMSEILGIAYEDVSLTESCCASLRALFDGNQHLHMARQIVSLNLEPRDLMTFSILLKSTVLDMESSITQHDLKDYMRPTEARMVFNTFKSGTNPLVRKRMIEPVCVSGQADPRMWAFTAQCVRETLRELNIYVETEETARKGLMFHEKIEEKRLYFSERVTNEFDRLASLLETGKMRDIMDNMERNKMRKCFTCLFYGGPGTGKTESVRQLARLSGRDIMMVDIPSIRSKWVGETEKNIKALFDRYRKLAEGKENAPILLFNEADAILGRRNDESTHSVDKMENAMQDIILQEMETLEGIMIATTNISANLDKAFERRFLYKIRFEQPDAVARRSIWKSMLPGLADGDYETLAERYVFSGGEIENVVRKYVIDNIINCRTSDITLLHELCRSEKLQETKRCNVGFSL